MLSSDRRQIAADGLRELLDEGNRRLVAVRFRQRREARDVREHERRFAHRVGELAIKDRR